MRCTLKTVKTVTLIGIATTSIKTKMLADSIPSRCGQFQNCAQTTPGVMPPGVKGGVLLENVTWLAKISSLYCRHPEIVDNMMKRMSSPDYDRSELMIWRSMLGNLNGNCRPPPMVLLNCLGLDGSINDQRHIPIP